VPAPHGLRALRLLHPERLIQGQILEPKETFSACRPGVLLPARARQGRGLRGPEASWGHRKNNLLRSEDELFYGYYLSAAIMMPGENGPPVPELARRGTVSSCRHDPVRAFVPVLTAMPAAGIALSDMPADSGYAHRAAAWALPLRAADAQLVQDLHPHDRGPKGIHQGAIISNGNLYCPCAPRSLLELGPPGRAASAGDITAHDAKTAETARYKLGRLTADDEDGLPPGAVPRHHRQDPLPAAPRLDDPGPGPAEILQPARAPPGLLRPADHHRPATRKRRTGQNRPSTSTGGSRSGG
jgi:hypothetical protein